MRDQSTVPYWAVDPFCCFIRRHFSLVEKNHATFPILSTFAKVVLAIPASAAKSERVFSKGGLLITPKRTCLAANILEDLVMVTLNTEFLDENDC